MHPLSFRGLARLSVVAWLALCLPASAQSVTGFTLINADSNQDLGPLQSGATLDLATLPTRNLNVRANTAATGVASVRFAYDGNSNFRTESTAPYAVAGDTNGDYLSWAPNPAVGSHTLTATAYSGTGATGTAGTPLTVQFTVVDGGGSGTCGTPAACGTGQAVVSGDRMMWHAVTLTFDGPSLSETSTPNPFLDYRLDVTFTAPSGRTRVVPGYFAADGDAANTSATSGGKWRVHLSPDEPGTWTYRASFRQGCKVAVGAASDGTAACFNGATGSFAVTATNKTGKDLRAQGRLDYVGGHHLRFAGSGAYYLKGGADSPENFLGYYEFDDTRDNGGSANDLVDGLHHYDAHLGDWTAADPTWKNGQGKRIIGALNYLASKGMNSVYFLTMNVLGDGREVYPWTSYTERVRYDVSKLAQWDVVFSHMTRKGLVLHVVTQETENDQLLDGGELGEQRKLYYRELIARFAHHPGLVWNLGEENTNTTAQRKAFADFFRAVDPYAHPTVIHTYPSDQDTVYPALLGHPTLDGPSLQGGPSEVHARTVKWIDASAVGQNGLPPRPWVVSQDEIGSADVGVVPDANDPSHDGVRKQVLWGNLMAGGGGVEWYFGYAYPHADLDCEDWRTRDAMWDQTRHALDFFQTWLPFHQMVHADGLTSSTTDYCLAKEGEVYAVYLPTGGSTSLDLGTSTATFTVHWYNPRSGGVLRTGSVTSITGPGSKSLGTPPDSATSDWVALVRRSTGSGGSVLGFSAVDDAFLENGVLDNTALLKVETSATRTRTSYLKFNVSGLNGRAVSAAKLRLTVDTDGGSGTVNAWLGSHATWTEGSLSSASAPTKGALMGSASGTFTVGATVELDLTGHVTADGTYSVVLDLASGGNDVWFGSDESTRRPVLELTVR